jgi:hypothetical protein
MKPISAALPALSLFLVALPCTVRAAKVTSDLLPPVRRQVAVDTAQRLAQRKPPAPLPADMASPFNPPGFDTPDAGELAAAAAAGRPVTAGPSAPGAPATPGRPGATAPAPSGRSPAPAVPAAPAGDRETLETLAAQITPSGTFDVGGKRQLIIKSNRFEVGTRFTATYNNQDYELELVAIDRTTFTLRYRGEEITRPIKPVR